MINDLIKATFITMLLPLIAYTGYGQHNSSLARMKAEVSRNGVFFREFAHNPSTENPVIVMVIHGDAPFNNPSYQYGIAKRIAMQNKEVIAIGVLRPGYRDEEGNSSKGVRGNATGDNYTPDVLQAIHQLSIELTEKYSPSKIVLVGHSGGAAISANLLSENPGFYSFAMLISCPCDVGAWRKHMKGLQGGNEIWEESVKSLSPIEEIKNLDDEVGIVVVHGDKDKIVPMPLAKEYVSALQANKKKADLKVLENGGHEIAFHPLVFELLEKIIAEP
jgi:dienelactone hydrolase